MIYINGVAIVGDMFKAVYDANGNGRVEKDALGITLNKLLKGAGTGVAPTEIDVPAALTLVNTEVFNGVSPNPSAWTDLNLSSVVGSNPALVVLRVYNPAGFIAGFAFRPNGETEYSNTGSQVRAFYVELTQTSHSLVLGLTDSAGIIEWWFGANNEPNTTIDVIGYLK